MVHSPSKINFEQTVFDIDVGQYRHPEHDIEPLFVNRWSPRAMTGEQISDEELSRLFEAARWAPSSYNNQPARFLYAKRGTLGWKTLFDLMVEQNQLWAGKAAVLMVIISRKVFDFTNQPSVTHTFDSGAAWENLALQGARMGLVVHGMQGFNYGKAKYVLNVPDDYQVEAMAAIGRPASKDTLPPQLQQREMPSGRKHVEQISFEIGSQNDFIKFLAASSKQE
jgi:nitroreductase